MINKVVIGKGAAFDYEEIVRKKTLNAKSLKEKAETAISDCKDLSDVLRIKIPDENGELMLFVRRGYRFMLMQTWIVEGICDASDYDPSMETDGTIKEWLEVIID